MDKFAPIARLAAALEQSGHEVQAVITNGFAQEQAQKILN